MPLPLPHIFLPEAPNTQTYRPRGGGGAAKIPSRDRGSHYQKLHDQFETISRTAEKVWRDAESHEGVTKDGIYLEFSSSGGFPLQVESLENRPSGVRLRNVQTKESDDSPIYSATLFFPRKALSVFQKKLEEYHAIETPTGKPKNEPLVNSIDQLCAGSLSSFWTDPPELMPKGNQPEWCEIWLDTFSNANAGSEFRTLAENIGIVLDAQDSALRFPDRIVLLGRTNQDQMKRLVSTCSSIAEFRRVKDTAHFFLASEPRHQAEWIEDLASRVNVRNETDVAVCVLDTGANNGHLLLQRILASSDCYAAKSKWTNTDIEGHGTGMCGLAAYGDLVAASLGSGPIEVDHLLESVKILTPSDPSEPNNYGAITLQGISQAEIHAPKRKRIGCMAVSSDARDQGRPSSWSAAIDGLLSGATDEERRIMFVAAGNVEASEAKNYPHTNLDASHAVQDPGQSWNAVTVGAFTEKDHISDPTLSGYRPLANKGELSPSSTTSISWSSDWPAKPDIVLEGGNYAKCPDGSIDTPDDFLLLTTGNKPHINQFGWINATSAATALAAKMAAEIQVRYPSAWPETIRGLMIHSAEWTEALKQQFLSISGKTEFQKKDYARFLQFCGYGIPNKLRALDCTKNSLTLISQAEIRPFEKIGSSIKPKDVHFYSLPWPKEQLLDLGSSKAVLRVTLSYFIEPAPGETGRNSRYQYASHLLRFDICKETESEEVFRRRINRGMDKNDGGAAEELEGGVADWQIGRQGRDKGSIHSDRIETNAANLATRNLIAVYPQTGWWRTRPHLEGWTKKARYSLIVSVTTEDQSVDIYTPVAIQTSVPVTVQV